MAQTGAIFFATKYGSTAEYAHWIGEATGLPVFDVDDASARPSDFDIVVIGSPIIYYKLFVRNWLDDNLPEIISRPAILFSVSGAGGSPKLDAWLDDSLPEGMADHVEHFALRGRQIPKDLTLYDRTMLIIGGLKNRDRVAGREEIRGFDYMDKSSIDPIVARVQELLDASDQGPSRVASQA